MATNGPRVPNTDSPKTEGKRFLRELDRQVKELEEREQNRPAPLDTSVDAQDVAHPGD